MENLYNIRMDVKELLNTYINEDLHRMLLSNGVSREGATKVSIRPVMLKGNLMYQAAETHGPKEIHKNFEKESIISYIGQALTGGFRQLQLEALSAEAFVLVSKKGKVTVRCKPRQSQERKKNKEELEHNRKKRYILEAGTPIPFLVDLGVMTGDGKIVHARYDKFRQMNRYLEFIEDILPALPKDREVTIVDFGCGKSYLTFAMYYYLHVKSGYDISIIGLDLKADVIEHCSKLASRYQYEKLKFFQGDIASFTGCGQVDMVVTLHACDTATDLALQKAVAWGAKVILSVPCCQHELNGQITNDILEPVMKYGILKERMAALLTDGLRGEMLRDMGYQVDILEFIEMEHTPKNLLIRAVRKNTLEQQKKPSGHICDCMDFFGAKPALYGLLYQQEAKEHEENCS